MQRFLLTLTVISFAGWSQSPQQQPQPPIVVQIQTPPANSWMRLVELIVPGIIGAGLALFGVWLTNRTNAGTSEANRRLELQKLNRQHSFELKREVLMRLTQSQVQTLAALTQWDSSRRYLERVEINGEEEHDELKHAQDEAAATLAEFKMRRNELRQATASSCLAVSDELWRLAQSVVVSILEAYRQLITKKSPCTKTDQQISKEIIRFIEAARKELGLVHTDA